MIRPPPNSTLFPYPTLFRSRRGWRPLFELLRRGPKRRPPFLDDARWWSGLDRQAERRGDIAPEQLRSEEHTSELHSHSDLVCRLLLEKKKKSYVRLM